MKYRSFLTLLSRTLILSFVFLASSVNAQRNDDLVGEIDLLNPTIQTPASTTGMSFAHEVGTVPADIMWVIDTSGSMGDDIDEVKARIIDFDSAMTAEGIDANYALVRFGGTPSLIQDVVSFDVFAAPGSPFSNLTDNGGGSERGSQADALGLNTANFRPNSVINVILVTDEDDDSSNTQFQAAIAAHNETGALFNFIGVPGTGNTNSRYGFLASENGGAAFDIAEFRSDPAPFFTNFIATKVEEIIEAAECDVDVDGDVDAVDINLVFAARNTPAESASDPRDPDRNGFINILDARICVGNCTNQNCTATTANLPPVANAGSDQSVLWGQTVQLDGSLSTDPEGTALSYQWSIFSAPISSLATFSDDTVSTPTIEPDVPGVYTFQLEVNDGSLGTDSDQVIVDVQSVAVPDVVGEDLTVAENQILTAGLSIGFVDFTTSTTVPVDQVIDQDPIGGAGVAITTLVNLLVSLGPNIVNVPDVIGLSQAQAELEIESAGLNVGSITFSSSTSIPSGNVIDQSPGPQSSAAEGSLVDIVVSSGPPPIVVPSFIGFNQADAEIAIAENGLVLGSVTFMASEFVAVGEVIAQNPSAGIEVTLGAAIDLVVSSGPDEGFELILELEQSVITAGDSTTLTARVIDANGEEIVPQPTFIINVSGVDQISSGGAPTLIDSTISTVADSRGVYNVTVVTGDMTLSASTEIVVIHQDEQSSLYADFSQDLNSTDRDVSDLVEALASADTTAALALQASLSTTNAAVEYEPLRVSAAFAPDMLFPPSVQQLMAQNILPTAVDQQYVDVLDDLVAAIQNAEDFIAQVGTQPDQNDTDQLLVLTQDIEAQLAQLNTLDPSVYGYVDGSSRLNYLLAVRIPRYMQNVIQFSVDFPVVASKEAGGNEGLTRGPANFLGGVGLQLRLINLIYGDLFEQIAIALILLELGDLFVNFANPAEIVQVVTGSSLVIGAFNVSNSHIDGVGFVREYPSRNAVYLIGPDAILQAQDIINLFNSSIPQSLGEIYAFFRQLINIAQGIEGAYDAANSEPDFVADCPFFRGGCDGLFYVDGFESVYQCNSIICIPQPVLVLVKNADTGAWSFTQLTFVATD